MKLKRIAKVLLSCVLAGALLTGCGGGGADNKTTDKVANNFSGDAVKLGVLTPLNSTEDKLGETLAKIEGETGEHSHKPKFFDNLKIMQLGIESGEVEEANLYKSVAEYVVANNDKFELVRHDALNKIEYSFHFAVRRDEETLKDEFDKTIDAMKADGTLDKLINDYVTNVDKGQAPPKVEIPMTDGAQTIKVGITGDLPPLDLILADNTPAGFNTAILAEVANRSGKNIELVQIETGSRAAALSSKLIDVIFWVVVPFGDKMPADIDTPEGLKLTDSYFKDNLATIKLKK